MTAAIAAFEDSALIEMALAGKTECFSVLMNRHKTRVRRRIMQMVKNTSDVDELVQDTFLKAWVHLSQFRFEASFCTWIMSVALNESLALYRRQRCRPYFQAPANLEVLASHDESPEQAWTRAEASLSVRAAIRSLPEKYAEILTLCELEQLGTLETARHLKASVPLVKSRLFRARQMLATALRRDVARRYAPLRSASSL